MMVTNMKDSVSLENEDDNHDADFRYNFRDNMIAQIKQDLYNKSFGHQDQDKHDDCLQKERSFGFNYVVNEGRPIPENVHDSDYDNPGRGYFLRGSK